MNTAVDFTLKIKRIQVLMGMSGCDKVMIYLDTPTPFPVMKYETCLSTDVQKGYGIQWAVETFGIAVPLEVVNGRYNDPPETT